LVIKEWFDAYIADFSTLPNPEKRLSFLNQPNIKMLTLKNVTLICVDCYNYGGAVSAIQKSIEKVQFAAVKFLTDIEIEVEGVDVVQISRINSKEDYSRFIVKELYKYFDTSHVLVIQHDGYVLNADVWDEDFLWYDYIGAPWLETDGYNTGNGGFSLRSLSLQYFLGTDKNITVTHPEDAQICRFYGPYLQSVGFKFAKEEVAEKFSFELRQPNQHTFGFHGKFHMPYKPYVFIRRYAAMGDVVRVEPVIDWFHKNGYNVILDTHPSFFKLFQHHHKPCIEILPNVSHLYCKAVYFQVRSNTCTVFPKDLHAQQVPPLPRNWPLPVVRCMTFRVEFHRLAG